MQALDGRVDRDDQGKEKRFPVILSAHEKLIARKVCLAFKVCTWNEFTDIYFNIANSLWF